MQATSTNVEKFAIWKPSSVIKTPKKRITWAANNAKLQTHEDHNLLEIFCGFIRWSRDHIVLLLIVEKHDFKHSLVTANGITGDKLD